MLTVFFLYSTISTDSDERRNTISELQISCKHRQHLLIPAQLPALYAVDSSINSALRPVNAVNVNRIPHWYHHAAREAEDRKLREHLYHHA